MGTHGKGLPQGRMGSWRQSQESFHFSWPLCTPKSEHGFHLQKPRKAPGIFISELSPRFCVRKPDLPSWVDSHFEHVPLDFPCPGLSFPTCAAQALGEVTSHMPLILALILQVVTYFLSSLLALASCLEEESSFHFQTVTRPSNLFVEWEYILVEYLLGRCLGPGLVVGRIYLLSPSLCLALVLT